MKGRMKQIGIGIVKLVIMLALLTLVGFIGTSHGAELPDSVAKLVDTVNAAVQKAGGAAERVWPEMVKQKALWGAMGLWFFGAAGVLAFVVGVLAFVKCVTYTTQNIYDDGAGAWAGFGVVSFLFALVFIGVAISCYPQYVYPEAALVRELLGQQ